MKNSNEIDDINILEIISTIWNEKIIVIVCTIFSIFISIYYTDTLKDKFTSIINLQVDTLPPFYKKDKVNLDFEKMFFSKNIFNKWKIQNPSLKMSFEEISDVINISDFFLSKNANNLLVSFKTLKNRHILIRTTKLSSLKEVYLYTKYVSNYIDNIYLIKAKQEIQIIKTRIQEIDNSGRLVSNLLALERYVVAVETNDTDTFLVKYPTIPKQISTPKSLIITFSIFLGFFSSLLIVFAKSRLKSRLT